MRRTLITAGIIASFLGASFGMAPVAEAASARDGRCDSGEFCLYYNSNHQGSLSDFNRSISDYGKAQPDCWEFKGPGNGKGTCVKNAAAAAWNRTASSVTIYFNSGYAGAHQTLAPGQKVNLNSALKNQNAGHRLDDNGQTTKTDMSDALYSGGGGWLTAGFDGYHGTQGRHEGIDFARGRGADVRALTSGTVIYVKEGSTNSLSTISIYNATYNKSIIYLHTDPRNSLYEGKQVSVGDIIADESDRAGGAPHTHVEMRNGRKTHAAKSVKDWTLENDNPTAFWQARGYNVR